MSENRINPLSIQLGYWSALSSVMAIVVYIVCFGLTVPVNPIFMWTNLADFIAYETEYRSPYPEIARFSMLIFALLFVVTLNCIYDYARPEHKTLARIGLCFGLGFALLTSTHYFVQISAVRLNLLKGDLEGLEQVIQANPYSAMSAMNMLAWTLLLGLTSLCVAWVFVEGRLERFVRITFLLNGVFCLLSGIGYVFELIWLLFLTVNLGTGGSLLVISVALTLLFRKRLRQ